MSEATQYDKSLGRLAREAAADLGDIVSKEVRLGRAEVSEKVDRVVSGLSGIAIGGALLIPAFTLLLFAAAYALDTVEGISLWAAMLIVGALAALVGYGLLRAGRRNVEPARLAPKKTMANVQRDAAAVKEAI